MNRGDLIDTFGISVNQSSTDLNRYLEIGPHPDLLDSQQKVVALDYGMRGGKAEIKERKALLYYALRRLGLDTDPSARKPQDQQIILINHAELNASAHVLSSKGGKEGEHD